MKPLLFENQPCGRCGGSGMYGPLCVQSGKCFSCGGRGSVLTKRGARAQDFLNALRDRRLDAFAVGDLFFVSGFSAGSFASPSCWYTVERIEAGSQNQNDAIVPTVTLHGRSRKTGESTSYTGGCGTMLRAGFSAEEKVEQIALAMAFQASLTKTGAVRKDAVLEVA